MTGNYYDSFPFLLLAGFFQFGDLCGPVNVQAPARSESITQSSEKDLGNGFGTLEASEARC